VNSHAGVLTQTWLLLGPPGAGKSRLARRLTTLLPALALAEALETTRLHRVAGLTGARTTPVTTRPCRAPHHHTISAVGLLGGGHVPRPGEALRAHHGRLVLDARPACRRPGLAVVRQSLEAGVTRRHARERPQRRRTHGRPP
jgi:magnesium chelatase family protein